MNLAARTDRLAQLMEQKLDIRGAGFETKLKRAGRLLPRHLRRDGQNLVDALALCDHPKLGQRLDPGRLKKSADALEKYLLDIDAWDRRRAIAAGLSASLLFNLLIVAALVFAVLIWRGYA